LATAVVLDAARERALELRDLPRSTLVFIGVWGAQTAGPPQDRFAVANLSRLAARQTLFYAIKRSYHKPLMMHE